MSHAQPLQPTATLRRYAGAYAAHAHAYAQVLVGLSGRLELELDGRATWVDGACALVVPPGVAHAYLAASPARVLVIDSPALPGLERTRRFVPPVSWKTQRGQLDADHIVGELASAAGVLQRRPIDLARIDAALDGQLHTRWSTARLAALCHLSAPQFHARFVALTGRTPADHVRARRLDRAEQLLRSGLGLEAVALQVGYASASALAYALRRERGLGARALRRAV
ncbi:MAG: AraC family transcriptional regulator [Hylemonella sp.]|uniref:AraC family transcriptional regulator n=1 Tax=Hylemonella sp. TaxID=2066020 RepID=UPI0022C6620D|nr:AraC family transcriptional regulator [Hylemonella sp.]MCZ8253972.1 AraC family transcriptional regulator [Hylemonella sp.]